VVSGQRATWARARFSARAFRQGAAPPEGGLGCEGAAQPLALLKFGYEAYTNAKLGRYLPLRAMRRAVNF